MRRHYVGQHSDPRCIYVPPSSGKTFYAFRIQYSSCGTKPDLNGMYRHGQCLIKRFVCIYELLFHLPVFFSLHKISIAFIPLFVLFSPYRYATALCRTILREYGTYLRVTCCILSSSIPKIGVIFTVNIT